MLGSSGGYYEVKIPIMAMVGRRSFRYSSCRLGCCVGGGATMKPKFKELVCRDCGDIFGAIWNKQGAVVYSGDARCRDCTWKKFISEFDKVFDSA